MAAISPAPVETSLGSKVVGAWADFFRRVAELFNDEWAVVSKVAAYTATDRDCLVLADASGGTFQITLPTAVGRKGKRFRIKNVGAANAVTVAASSGDIDGAASKSLDTQFACIEVESDDTDYFIIAQMGTVT